MKTLAYWAGAALCAGLLTASAAAAAPDHRPRPLVYSVENTGAKYPAPFFAPMAQLPIVRPLPDPFVFLPDSPRDHVTRRDTSFASWERRRNQIKAAIEKYEIGPKPDCSDCTITATYTPPAAGSTAKGVLTVVVTRNGKSLTLTSGVFIPTGMGSSPFPVLIPMTFFASPTGANPGSLPGSVVTSRPIATIDFVHNNVTALSLFGSADHSADPFYQLYPELCAGTCTGGKVSNSGQYAAWSWGVSRLIDGIEIASHQAVNPLPVDVKHVAVTGCSYAGKMALFAGALDERVALTIAQENGGGGAPSWRVSHEIEAPGSVEDIHDTNYDWFAGQMKVDEITGGAPYGATTMAGLDAQLQPSETSFPAPDTRCAPSRRPPPNCMAERRDQNAAGRWPRRPRNRAERVLAAWKRRRKTRTAWNRPSTTCSPTYGERAARFGFRAWISPRRLRA